jgi:hypothetical protein
MVTNRVRTTGYKCTRPSKYEQGEPPEVSSPFVNGDYSFSKRVNRIRDERQIEPLFDNTVKINENRKRRSSHYYGQISGIDVRIDFSRNHPCFICVKKEEELGIAYNKVLDILIKEN